MKGEGEVGVEKEGGGGERRLRGEEGELEAQLGLARGGFTGNLGDGGSGEAAGEEAVEDGAAEGELGGSAGREEEKRILRAGLALAVGGRGGGSRGLRCRRPHRRRARRKGESGFERSRVVSRWDRRGEIFGDFLG